MPSSSSPKTYAADLSYDEIEDYFGRNEMPKVNYVKKARKDQPGGIKAGEPYYWWQFKFGPRCCSKEPPRPSQLTRSEFLGGMLSLQEQVENMAVDGMDLQAAANELRAVAEEVQSLGQDQEEKAGNMPENLQSSEQAEMMTARAEAAESIADELEAAADDVESLAEAAEDPEEPLDDLAEDRAEAARDVISNVSWDFE